MPFIVYILNNNRPTNNRRYNHVNHCSLMHEYGVKCKWLYLTTERGSQQQRLPLKHGKVREMLQCVSPQHNNGIKSLGTCNPFSFRLLFKTRTSQYDLSSSVLWLCILRDKVDFTIVKLSLTCSIDWVKVLHPIRYNITHFEDVLPRKTLG